MFKQNIKHLFDGCIDGYGRVRNCHHTTGLPLEKILIISKLSRYEYEKIKLGCPNEIEFKKQLESRGSDYNILQYYHHLHKKFENYVKQALRQTGSIVRVANRFNYNDEMVEWADCVIPTGGDGTFLLAASRIKNNQKPVIGFNSDPIRSEGFLCLPKRYSNEIELAIKRLRHGEFDWLLRSRIQIKLINGNASPEYLHDANLASSATDGAARRTGCQLLPVLALNEVFIGEALSARVSHLGMRIDDADNDTNMKCSGICICTGTGSTSWHLSINRLPIQTVAELLNIIEYNMNDATKIADYYNKRLIFPSDDNRMGYTIRDLISAGVWPKPKGIKSRGFAKQLIVNSKCYDARLVIDGGVSFEFNDGTIAILDINPTNALRTVIMAD